MRTVPSPPIGLIALVLLGHAAIAAQDTPDLSGTWVLESTVPPAAGVPRAITFTPSIVRTDVRGEPVKPFVKELTVTRVASDGARSETYQLGVVSGRVGGSSRTARAAQTRQVQWEDQALVIETGGTTSATRGAESSERREVWSLDSRQRLRGTISTRSAVGAWETVIALYRHQ